MKSAGMSERYLIQGADEEILAFGADFQGDIDISLVSQGAPSSVYLLILRAEHADLRHSLLKAAKKLHLIVSRDQLLWIPRGTDPPESDSIKLLLSERFRKVKEDILPEALRSLLDSLPTSWPTIAVIDTGFRWSNHFKEADISSYICRPEDCQIVIDTSRMQDVLGHGTRCIGLISARSSRPNEPSYGLALDAGILALQAFNASPLPENSIWLSNIISALKSIEDRIDGGQNIDIVSASWGTYELDSKNRTLLKKSMKDLSAKGVLFVVAAGNDDRDINSNYYYPAVWSREKNLAILTVGGSDWLSSNEGTSVSIRAPANGLHVLCTGLVYTAGEPPCYRSGTSYSTALMAGVAAMVVKRCPQIKGVDLQKFIIRNMAGYKKILTIPPLETWQQEICSH